MHGKEVLVGLNMGLQTPSSFDRSRLGVLTQWPSVRGIRSWIHMEGFEVSGMLLGILQQRKHTVAMGPYITYSWKKAQQFCWSIIF